MCICAAAPMLVATALLSIDIPVAGISIARAAVSGDMPWMRGGALSPPVAVGGTTVLVAPSVNSAWV